MDERQRIAFLAKHFNRLKNLRLAPVYLLFTVPTWLNFNQVSVLDGLIALSFCIVWFWLLNRYYKEHYGQIENKYVGRNTTIGGWLATWSYLAIALVAGYFVIRGSYLPQDFILWFVPASMFSEGLAYSDAGLRRWYYVGAGAICGVALLFGFASSMPLHHFFRVYEFAVLGIVFLTLSIFDHLLLMHSFHPISSEINA